MDYKFSPGAVELIKKFEGYRSKPYLDSKKVPTIGFGTVYYPSGKVVTMKDSSIDLTTACEMLLFHLNEVELPDLEKCITRKDLNQKQVDAIGCLMYNIGDTGFCGSTLHKLINANASIDEIKKHWLEWDRADGQVVDGLLKRRTIEFNYYIS